MATGTAAAEGCDDFGWSPQGRVDTALVTEIAQHPRLGMGHAWSRSGDYVLSPAPERIHLVLTVAKQRVHIRIPDTLGGSWTSAGG
jgi:hypothetical protein